MSLLTKAQILAADDLPTREVDVPEWGGSIRIRMFTAAQRLALESEYKHAVDAGMIAPSNWREMHLVMAAVDEKGEPLFTDGDAAALGRKSGRAMARVFAEINAFNLGEGLEQTAKN
jgi:hypothetical protein